MKRCGIQKKSTAKASEDPEGCGFSKGRSSPKGRGSPKGHRSPEEPKDGETIELNNLNVEEKI